MRLIAMLYSVQAEPINDTQGKVVSSPSVSRSPIPLLEQVPSRKRGYGRRRTTLESIKKHVSAEATVYSVFDMGKVAIVTGSSRGIGRAIAIRIAQDGYDVCVNDIEANKQGCEEVAQEIQKLGRKACVATADVSQLSEVEAMIQTAVKELGNLNTMIANAGIAQVKPLLELTEDDFKRMFEVNVYGVHNCYQAAAKQLIKQGNCTPESMGKLIGCASIVAFKPFALLSHYSASKWAVRGLSQAYAMEMAEHNITVNAYAPGIVGTAMWDLIDEKLGEKDGRKKGDTIKKYTNELIAQKRTSVPEDVAKLVSFLAGPDSDHVTGQTQIVDGGIIFT